MGATLLGDWRLMTPGRMPCTSATPAPQRAAVASNTAVSLATSLSAQPSAIRSNEPLMAFFAPSLFNAVGATQAPTPMSAMGSSVSQESWLRFIPVAVLTAWPSGPMAVRKGRRLMVIATTTRIQRIGEIFLFLLLSLL